MAGDGLGPGVDLVAEVLQIFTTQPTMEEIAVGREGTSPFARELGTHLHGARNEGAKHLQPALNGGKSRGTELHCRVALAICYEAAPVSCWAYYRSKLWGKKLTSRILRKCPTCEFSRHVLPPSTSYLRILAARPTCEFSRHAAALPANSRATPSLRTSLAGRSATFMGGCKDSQYSCLWALLV